MNRAHSPADMNWKVFLPFLGTYSVRCEHILRLLLFVLGVHLKGVSLLKVLLEQRQLLLSQAGGGRSLSARRDGRRPTLAHELKLLHFKMRQRHTRDGFRMKECY